MKNTKNRAQKLTRKEKIFLNKIINNYRDAFLYLTAKYSKPISLWKDGKKLLTTKNKKALFESIVSIKNDILPQSFKPAELNNVLSSCIHHDINRFSRINESSGRPSIYYIPKDMEYTKKLLEKPLSIEYIKNKVSKLDIIKKIPEYYFPL